MHTFATINEEGLKAQAQLLKMFLNSKDIALNHMACLDAVSVQHGYPSWQHARAVLTQPAEPRLPPREAAEAQAKQVGDLIVAAGAVHKTTLLELAQSILENGPLVTYAGRYERKDGPEGIERVCQLIAHMPFGDWGVKIYAELSFELRFDVDALCVSPTAFLYASSPGYGERGPSGLSKGEIDWNCCYNGTEFALQLSDPTWPKKLKSFVQDIPLRAWIQKELDDEGTTLKDASAHFEKVLFED